MESFAEAQLVARLTAVFRDVFDDDSIVLSPTLVAADVDGWDSLGHIRLVVAVEVEFSIRFSSSEIASWKNVGAFIASITDKLR